MKHNEAVLFHKPIINSHISPGSRATVCIELFCKNIDGEDVAVGFGSGFFYARDDKTYLITNWHVVTGRNPSNPELTIDNYPASPSGFRFYTASKSNPSFFKPSPIFPLYVNGQAGWVEVDSKEIYDVVALEISFEEDADVLIEPINKFAINEDFKNVYVGCDVVIIGYPFGIGNANPYPVWKHGYIASEPSILIDGAPKMFIDSPGLPGMSGSPIYMVSKGVNLPAKSIDILKSQGGIRDFDMSEFLSAPETCVLNFVGIYSGSLGDGAFEKMRLGIAWHRFIVDLLFNKPRKGVNPYPPLQ
ncbi:MULTISPECIES: S1 family peptidase [Aeromonas]|uniref:S1 family peptidase n=1 Tax=Aeromonas TaxID=642 RepID=UPI0038CF373F